MREGCVTPALPAKLGRGPGPCWEEQFSVILFWMPATPYVGNGHGICMYVEINVVLMTDLLFVRSLPICNFTFSWIFISYCNFGL